MIRERAVRDLGASAFAPFRYIVLCRYSLNKGSIRQNQTGVILFVRPDRGYYKLVVCLTPKLPPRGSSYVSAQPRTVAFDLIRLRSFTKAGAASQLAPEPVR